MKMDEENNYRRCLEDRITFHIPDARISFDAQWDEYNKSYCLIMIIISQEYDHMMLDSALSSVLQRLDSKYNNRINNTMFMINGASY